MAAEAAQVHEIYRTYVEAGFTPAQALHLVADDHRHEPPEQPRHTRRHRQLERCRTATRGR